MLNKTTYAIMISLFLMTGCGTITRTGKETVTITSNVENTDLWVRNRSGELVYDGKAPATLNLKKKYSYFHGEKYTIYAQKVGYPSQKVILDTELNGWYFGNVIFMGGLVGYLIIDPITGGMWRFENSSVSIDMNTSPSALKNEEK